MRVHTREHLKKIESLNEYLGVDAGLHTPMGRGSFEIAKLAAGGVIEAVDAVLDGTVRNAYALVRPPGHHALADVAMGFCIFGNAAIAGLHLLDVRKLGRIATVDWDVHHGNGTQAAFWKDSRALTISIHQDNCFPPNSGYMTDIGEGPRRGLQHQTSPCRPDPASARTKPHSTGSSCPRSRRTSPTSSSCPAVWTPAPGIRSDDRC